MDRVNYLNVGCGVKFHTAWTNVDMVSSSPFVQAHNLLKGLPYPDGTFDLVYHSQVLEHFPKDKAAGFLAECLRVLKPGGLLRVVVPDLEDIATEYLRLLKANLEQPSATSIANYDWILLEMYDQTVRNRSGGQMVTYLQQPGLVNEQYVVDRIGYVAHSNIDTARGQRVESKHNAPAPTLTQRLRRLTPSRLAERIGARLRDRFGSEALRVGTFRLGGEIHQWMYDRFSLSRLLLQVGFEGISRVDPFTSAAADWSRYELDVKNGRPYDPTSLFMEARKPLAQASTGRAT